jgi:dTMP kinase
MTNPHKGKFITLEGGEGTGKSTQIELMVQFLKKRGTPVMSTREPGGSEGAELIRHLLVNGEVHRWDSVTEVLLMNAARRDHLKSVIIPALEAGVWVVCDRFADSTLAYQGYGHGVALPYLNTIYELIAGSLTPDLTFIFDLDPRLGIERAQGRGGSEDRFERMPMEFHDRIREGFRRIAQTDLNRYILIDASLDREAISKQIQEYIEQRLK